MESAAASLKMISDCFIKPKLISEEPTYLSPWDLAMMNINYIQKGLLYPLPKNNDDFSITTFLLHLKDSLSATLTHFHPLAGRLTTVKQSQSPSMAVFVNPVNSPGARFIHASVNLTIDDILTPTDVPQIVQSFFDHHKAIGHDGHQQSLLSIQVTELVDGIFIGCSINHVLVDGSSYWHFFKSLSEVFRSKPISRPPVLKRWRSDPILTLPFTHEDEFIDRPNQPLVRQRIFHLSSSSLAKLKAKVNSECGNTNNSISTLQSLSAVVWRCVTRARRFPAEQETGCRLAVNNRSRLSPPLPENYFGNSIQTVGFTTTAGELLNEMSVGMTAWRLHEAVVKHGDKQVREHMDSWPFVYKADVFFDGKGVQMGSSPRFDMYGIEFGELGKGVAVLGGNANKYDGKVTLYEAREGGPSMDLELCLLPENMALFESDQEFMSLVQL